MKELRARKNIRLQSHDYSQSALYFLTICVKEKHEMLGKVVVVGEHSVLPRLSEIGEVVETAIGMIPKQYKMARVEKYVIMPNHIHMIVSILSNGETRSGGRERNNGSENGEAERGGKGNGGSTLCSPTSIPRIVKHLKEYVTKRIGFSIWQTSYHDHIIRSEEDYWRIVEYIEQNPVNWEQDFDYIAGERDKDLRE